MSQEDQTQPCRYISSKKRLTRVLLTSCCLLYFTPVGLYYKKINQRLSTCKRLPLSPRCNVQDQGSKQVAIKIYNPQSQFEEDKQFSAGELQINIALCTDITHLLFLISWTACFSVSLHHIYTSATSMNIVLSCSHILFSKVLAPIARGFSTSSYSTFLLPPGGQGKDCYFT